MIPLQHQQWPTSRSRGRRGPCAARRRRRPSPPRARRARRRARRPSGVWARRRRAARGRPKPKRVNSYSELNFSSIVRVDSLGTMALPAFGEGGSASEDENSKRRPARAPSFGIDVDEEEETGETERRADTTAGATPPAIVAAFGSRPMPPPPVPQPRGASPGVVTASPGPTPPPPSRPSVRRNARSFAELGEEEVVREESEWVAPEPQPRPSPPIAIGQPAPQTRASPPIAIAPRGPRSPPLRPPARSAEPRFPTGHRGFGERWTWAASRRARRRLPGRGADSLCEPNHRLSSPCVWRHIRN